jgi:hypothetical protein
MRGEMSRDGDEMGLSGTGHPCKCSSGSGLLVERRVVADAWFTGHGRFCLINRGVGVEGDGTRVHRGPLLWLDQADVGTLGSVASHSCCRGHGRSGGSRLSWSVLGIDRC